ncbi:ABC-2 transporter permease [Clostridium saccharobutylicum]|uniref:ABC-2 transporter permease n=1 Tax=Clostridium saccharobutylicum TaxID=169679 RepID=UPI0015F9D7DC|nr:ABC-2 transporter permease [Clostridium saccharobutylicum]MBC2441329.1 ABC-2 transporter permease [Clostridium saccharobutylicum]
MKDSINYLKFDLRITKESTKFQILIIALFYIIFMFFKHDYVFGMSYLFFLLIIFSRIPFSLQGNEKSTEMYYMFPAKISSMVLGRFLYLISYMFLIFTICGINILYLSLQNKISNIEMVVILLSAIISGILCFIQYPIYYKFGSEKAVTFIYFLPAIGVLALPNFLLEKNIYLGENILQNIDFNNIIILIMFGLVILIFIGYISYLSSFKICKKREI